MGFLKKIFGKKVENHEVQDQELKFDWFHPWKVEGGILNQPIFGEGKKPSETQLLKQIHKPLQSPQYYLNEQCEFGLETAKMIINFGEEGIELLCDCIRDVFKIRPPNHYLEPLLYAAFWVILHTKDERLLSLLNEILEDGKHLIRGKPERPAWIPEDAWVPQIVGADNFGWDDSTYGSIADIIMKFITEEIRQ